MMLVYMAWARALLKWPGQAAPRICQETFVSVISAAPLAILMPAAYILLMSS